MFGRQTQLTKAKFTKVIDQGSDDRSSNFVRFVQAKNVLYSWLVAAPPSVQTRENLNRRERIHFKMEQKFFVALGSQERRFGDGQDPIAAVDRR